jgi:glycosyltransferase involved in cell wall biosynthesis
VPFYNEEAGVDLFFHRVEPVLEKLGADYEIVCVNDGSRDRTLELLLAHRARNPRVVVVDLSRNFGKDIALTAAIDHTKGRAVIPMDCDLQDPPEAIPALVAKWREGWDMVVAKRASRESDTALKRLSAGWFYKLFNKLSSVPIPENAGDFRLMDRRVVDAVKSLPEGNRFMKGLFAWVGFRTAEIEYVREPRAKGSSKFNFWKLWNFALDGIFSFSSVPLRIWGYVGMAISGFSLLYALYLVVRTLFYGRDVPGYASLMVAILFMGGIQLLSLGIIGEYVGRIYNETKRRPLYLTRSVSAGARIPLPTSQGGNGLAAPSGVSADFQPVDASPPPGGRESLLHPWTVPFRAFLFSRIMIFAILAIGAVAWKCEVKPGQWKVENLPAVVEGLCRWDAGWYGSIVGEGYAYEPGSSSNVAFFPLFPLCTGGIARVLNCSWTERWWVYFLFNNAVFWIALMLAYRLAAALTGDAAVAGTTVFLLAFQPASVFFSAPYSESLFLLLATGTLLAAKKERWAVAGILGLFCSATRNLGVFLAPAVGLMWLAANGISWRDFASAKRLRAFGNLLLSRRSWLWVFLIPCGLFAYMLFLHLRFGNAMAFVEVQKYWGHRILGFWNILGGQIGDILSGQGSWSDCIDTFSALLFLLLSLVAWKRFGIGIGIFCLACVLIPASATTISMTRYVSVIVPSFVILALFLSRHGLRSAVIGFSAGLCGVFALLFSHWVFVG